MCQFPNRTVGSTPSKRRLGLPPTRRGLCHTCSVVPESRLECRSFAASTSAVLNQVKGFHPSEFKPSRKRRLKLISNVTCRAVRGDEIARAAHREAPRARTGAVFTWDRYPAR